MVLDRTTKLRRLVAHDVRGARGRAPSLIKNQRKTTGYVGQVARPPNNLELFT